MLWLGGGRHGRNQALGLDVPRIGFSHRCCEARRAHLDIDGARLEALRQDHILLELLEIAELERQLPVPARRISHLGQPELLGPVGAHAFDLDADRARHHRVLAHRLLQHEQQAVVRGGAPRLDLKTLDAQSADAVLGRDDAAVESELLALLEDLGLQVFEVLLHDPVRFVVDLARQLRLGDVAAQLLVLLLERVDLRRELAAPLQLGKLAVAAGEAAPFVNHVQQQQPAQHADDRKSPPSPGRLISDYELTGAHRSG